MTRWIFWMFVLCGLEGALSYWVFPFAGSNQWLIVPHLILIRLIVWTYEGHGQRVLWFALCTGWLQDLTIGTPLLGEHAFAYALTVIVIGWYSAWQPNPDTPRWLSGFSIGLLCCDLTLYVLNRMFSQTDVSFFWIIGQHLLPNLILHVMILFVGIGIRNVWRANRINGI